MASKVSFSVRRPLWHIVPGKHDFNRLANPNSVKQLDLEAIDPAFAGMLYRSDMVLMEADLSGPHYGGPGKPSWLDCVKYTLMLPVIPQHPRPTCWDSRFVIACMSPASGSLRLCSEPRLVSEKGLAMRAASERQFVFLLADHRLNLSCHGHYGPDNQPDFATKPELVKNFNVPLALL